MYSCVFSLVHALDVPSSYMFLQFYPCVRSEASFLKTYKFDDKGTYQTLIIGGRLLGIVGGKRIG